MQQSNIKRYLNIYNQMSQIQKQQNNKYKSQKETVKRKIQYEWEYRYIKLTESQTEIDISKKQLEIFYFLGDFKDHCLKIVKQIIDSEFDYEIDQFNYRYHYIRSGQKMFLKDNIMIRIAKNLDINGQINTQSTKLLARQFLTNNVLNNLLFTITDNKFKYRVPLSCLVDYLGYKAFCQADTTCQGQKTIIYGPMSNKLFKHHQAIQADLLMIGKCLNIRPFSIITKSNQKIKIPFCLNVQVHFARYQIYDQLNKYINPNSYLYSENNLTYKRDQFYLYEVEKIWPMFIDKELQNNVGYLRPEYVLNWKKRLSNCVFLNVSPDVDEKCEHDIAEACKTLKQDQTQLLVTKLDNSQLILIDSNTISTVFHEFGINLRFMGIVTKKSRMLHVKSILKTQMIARVLKKMFFINLTSQKEAKQNLVDLLNLIFINNQQSQEFWKNVVYPKIFQYYQFKFVEYPPNIPGGGLLHAISQNFRVNLKHRDYGFFMPQKKNLTFSQNSIEEFIGNAKTFDLDTFKIKMICKSYKQKKNNKLYVECLKELQILISIHRGLHHNPHELKPYPQGIYYAEAAEVLMHLNFYDDAYKYAQNALQCLPEYHAERVKSLCILIKCYSSKKRLDKSLQNYDKALATISYHLGNNHPLFMSVYNILAFQYLKNNQLEKCEKILKKSFQVCTQTLGYLHRSCSQILLQLAKLPMPPSVSIGYLTQCLNILEALKSDQQQITSVRVMITRKYEQIGNNQKMLKYAKISKNWFLQLKAFEKNAQYDQIIDICTKQVQPLHNNDQILFVAQKFFKAYVQFLTPESISFLYKLYVASYQMLKTREQAFESILNLFAKQNNNLGLLISKTLNPFLQNMQQIMSSKQFYVNLPNLIARSRDSRLRGTLQKFIIIVSIIGEKSINKILNDTKIQT